MTKKIHRNPVDLGSESNRSVFVPRGFYLVENKSENVDPNTLFITQVSVARTKGPTRFIPHISFGAVGRGDFVKWGACPDYSPDAWKETTPDCRSGQTLDPMLEITDLEPGPWLISLQYCLSNKDQKNCGPVNSISWLQASPFDPMLDAKHRQITKAKAEIGLLGVKLQNILSDFNTYLKLCYDTGLGKSDQEKYQTQSVIDMIQIETENLKNLGPEFLADTLARAPLSDEEVLAQIVQNIAKEPARLALADTTPTSKPPTGPVCPPISAAGQLIYQLCYECFHDMEGNCTKQNCKALPPVSKADIQNALLGISGAVVQSQNPQQNPVLSCASPKSEKLEEQNFGNSRQENLRIAVCKVLLQSSDICPEDAQKAAAYLAVLKTLNDLTAPPPTADSSNKGYFECQALERTQNELAAFRAELARLKAIIANNR